MEKPKIGIEKPEEPKKQEDERFNPERVDRLIATRMKNARTMAEMEEMFSQANIDGENFDKLFDGIEKRFEDLDIGYDKEKRQKKFLAAAREYLFQRRTGLIQEKEFQHQIGTFASSNEDLGTHIFRLRTKAESKEAVTAEQKEGYFIFYFKNAIDFSRFSKGIISEEDMAKSEITAGRYHRAIKLPETTMKALLIIGDPLSAKSVLLHERQHFLNDAAFDNFRGTESETSISNIFSESRMQYPEYLAEQVRDMKDEVLAYIRDGSSAERVVGFLDNKELYGHLMNAFAPHEQEEIKKLMQKIREKLPYLLNLFTLDERALLVYQLIDVPLDRFPVILDRMEKYYKRKLEPIGVFKYPPLKVKDYIEHPELVVLQKEIRNQETLSRGKIIYDEDASEAIGELESLRKKYMEVYEEILLQKVKNKLA